MAVEQPADGTRDERSGHSRFRTAYGAGPLHLLGMLAAFALAAYTISVVGLSALWDPNVWWQSIIVWFLGAVIAHDLILFPLYALADRLTQRGLHTADTAGPVTATQPRRDVSLLNHLRIPVIAVALLFLLFFPGIIQQGAGTYLAATGQTQAPFLHRWLLLSGAIFALSAVIYGGRLLVAARLRASDPPAAGHRDEHPAQ